MENTTCNKLDYLDKLVAADLIYQEMLHRCGIIEKQFDAMVKELPDEHRALAWDFVMLCEDMSRRALEIACENMEIKNAPV